MGKGRDAPEIERGEKTISSDKDHKQNYSVGRIGRDQLLFHATGEMVV